MANLNEMMENVTAKAIAYVKAYNDGKKKSELKALKTAATNAVNEYNLELSKATYRRWAKEGDAVKTAIRVLYIPGARSIKYKTDDENYMTCILSDANFEVNLPQMQATLGTKAFADPKWFNKCEKLAYIVANAINEHMGNSAMFNYGIEDASKEFSFPEGMNPLDDEGVVYALQSVFDAILFIEDEDAPGNNLIKTRIKKDSRGNAFSVEWQYIRESMTANSGVGKVAVCNTGRFTSYILHAMHVILTSGDIGFESTGDFVMPKSECDE